MSNGIYSSLSLSLSLLSKNKGGCIGHLILRSPLTLSKGGQRLSDGSQRLSDAIGGGL